MRAFFVPANNGLLLMASSRAGSLPHEPCEHPSNVGASLLAKGPALSAKIYREETR